MKRGTTINYIKVTDSFINFSKEIAEIINDKLDYSYDVTTDSDHFEVSGIYSHNCRNAKWLLENGSVLPEYVVY